MMHVPEHISVTGEPLPMGASDSRRYPVSDRARIMEMMNVPDRIVITGGGGYRGANDIRNEGYRGYGDSDKIELNDLPSHLTLADTVYPEEPVSRTFKEDIRSQSSIAIDENPLQELKIMRRQLGKLSNRLYELEADIENHKTTENRYFIGTIIGFISVVVVMLLRK